MPSGYTKYRWIGFVSTDSLNELVFYKDLATNPPINNGSSLNVTNSYLALLNSGAYGVYWGSGVKNTWYHDSWFYVR